VTMQIPNRFAIKIAALEMSSPPFKGRPVSRFTLFDFLVAPPQARLLVECNEPPAVVEGQLL
jgi:hypothetical protein